PRVTVYLATEAFHTAIPRVPNPPAAPPSPEAIVEHYERNSFALHPFFHRLRREPVNPGVLWLLMVNTREGMTRHFARRLASVVARVDDVRIRSVLARQLNDELGDGDASRAHSLLFDNLVDGLDPLKPADVPPDVLASGREMGRRLEDLYVRRDAMEGVG